MSCCSTFLLVCPPSYSSVKPGLKRYVPLLAHEGKRLGLLVPVPHWILSRFDLPHIHIHPCAQNFQTHPQYTHIHMSADLEGGSWERLSSASYGREHEGGETPAAPIMVLSRAYRVPVSASVWSYIDVASFISLSLSFLTSKSGLLLRLLLLSLLVF